jgi:hypothetical protein
MKTVLIAAIAALLAGTAGAYAQTSHILGHGGPQIKLDAMCHREVVAVPGPNAMGQSNINAQQIKCLIRRPDPFARCVKRLGAAPTVVGKFDHGVGKPADWSGVDKLQAYVAAVGQCASAQLATVRTRG